MTIPEVEMNLVENLLKQLTSKFGQDSPLNTYSGKVLDYLEITIDYRNNGKVKFSMQEYINILLEEVPFEMDGTAKTLATNHLFNVNTKKLTEAKAQLFHHIVVDLIYFCRKTRQDIQTAVAFLRTWVKSPDKDDYKKSNTIY